MPDYEIVDRGEIEPPSRNRWMREDINELLLAVPQDGRVLRKDYSSRKDLERDYQVLMNRIKSNKLNIILMKRVLRLYIMQRDEELK